MFAASAFEHGWRGDDTVAQEHVRRACGVPVELDVPRERVARIDLLECHLEDRLRGMSHVGLQVGTARLFAGRERRVLVSVGPGDEEGAGAQGQICFDRFVGRLEVVLGVRRREAQGPLRLRIEEIGTPAPARRVRGIGDGYARGMGRRGGDLARHALHEDVVGPARGRVEKLDDVVGGTDRPGQEVCRAPGAGEEALKDGAPRGQLGRRREHVFVVLVGRVRRGAGSVHVGD